MMMLPPKDGISSTTMPPKDLPLHLPDEIWRQIRRSTTVGTGLFTTTGRALTCRQQYEEIEHRWIVPKGVVKGHNGLSVYAAGMYLIHPRRLRPALRPTQQASKREEGTEPAYAILQKPGRTLTRLSRPKPLSDSYSRQLRRRCIAQRLYCPTRPRLYSGSRRDPRRRARRPGDTSHSPARRDTRTVLAHMAMNTRLHPTMTAVLHMGIALARVHTSAYLFVSLSKL